MDLYGIVGRNESGQAHRVLRLVERLGLADMADSRNFIVARTGSR